MADVKEMGSLSTLVRPATGRRVKAVPFVEIFGGRLQGVVSSGSDIERVYVSFFEGSTGNYGCSTNNNRPCSGVGRGPCGHLWEMLGEGWNQFGVERLVSGLKLPCDAGQIANVSQLRKFLGHGQLMREQASSVFSRFLNYLEHTQRPTSAVPTPEMAWFICG
jgi:hypothetical protein